MRRKTVFTTLAVAAFFAALPYMFFAPPRIGHHTDHFPHQPAEQWRWSVASYYFIGHKARGNEHIGTTPYTQYYVRTYALDLWLLSGVCALLAIRAKDSRPASKT